MTSIIDELNQEMWRIYLTPSDILARNLSYFEAPVTNTIPSGRVGLLDVFGKIFDSSFVEKTAKCRTIVDRKERSKFKREHLDSVTWSGQFTERNDDSMLCPSPFACFDFDHLAERKEEVHQLLINDPKVVTALLFTSPSGDGFKWIVVIDTRIASYPTWYRAISNYVAATYGLQIDSSCSNLSRACFLCHDLNVYLNPLFRQQEFTLSLPMQKEEVESWAQKSEPKKTGKPMVKSSASSAAMTNGVDLETEVQQVVQALTSRGIDITVGYANWRNLAFALADGLGESGRSHFHALSRLHPDYNYTECDKQYTACLYGRGSGITIKTFFAMAKEAGVDLSDVSAKSATLPSGRNREKVAKMGDFDDFGGILPNGKMAEVAESSPPTFSDKLEIDDLPLFLHPIWEQHTDPADREKMLLGVLNVVSGIIPPSVFGIYAQRVVYAPCYCIVFGPFASSKGDLEACRQLAQPIVEEIRKQYEREMAAYKLELAAWESLGKGKQGPKPEEPVKHSPFISANSSSSAVYRALEANGGSGMIFETEADTLTNMLSNKDYGNYSDLLRRAFHHETITMLRVTDQIDIEIEEPRLAVFLTCTGNQLELLLPAANISNGLASRFLFYELARKEICFRNVFAGNEKTLKSIYREMGEQLLPLYHDLAARESCSIQFVFSQSQQEEFQAAFDAMVKEQCRLSGDEIQGFVYRLAHSGFRYAMILSLLRRLTADRENYFDLHEKALICDDRDFRTMMTIMTCLIKHTARVYSVIGQQVQDPFQQDLSKLKENMRNFYRALPDQTFSSGEAIQIAKGLDIPERTAYRWLGKLFSKFSLLRSNKTGYYEKCYPKQDDSAD